MAVDSVTHNNGSATNESSTSPELPEHVETKNSNETGPKYSQKNINILKRSYQNPKVIIPLSAIANLAISLCLIFLTSRVFKPYPITNDKDQKTGEKTQENNGEKSPESPFSGLLNTNEKPESENQPGVENPVNQNLPQLNIPQSEPEVNAEPLPNPMPKPEPQPEPEMQTVVFPADSLSRADKQKTGVYKTDPLSSQPTLKWLYKNRKLPSAPAVSESTVYAGSYDGKMVAIDIQSGKVSWEYPAETTIYTTPSIKSERIFFADYNGNIYSLNKYTGKLIWKAKLDYGTGSSSVIDNDKLYATSKDGTFYEMEASTGKILWKKKVGSYSMASPAINEGTIYLTSGDTNLYVYKNRDSLWEFGTDNAVFTSPTYANNTVYVLSEDSYLYAVDASSHQTKWSYKYRYNPSIQVEMVSEISVDGGSVYVPVNDNKLVVLDSGSGKVKWNLDIEGWVTSPFSRAGNVVYFGTTKIDDVNREGYLYAVDTDDKNVLWKYPVKKGIKDSPVVLNNHVFVVSEEGFLYVLN